MSQILDLLRPGDILTHCYSGAPNLGGAFTNIVQDGRLLPAALAAKQRGVVFDVGHGGGSFDYTVAEAAIAQGAPPDTISSDIHVFSGNSPGMPYLTWVMSKFMGLGFTLEQVVAMATVNPAKVINRAPKLGTLQVGAPGDVAIMELVRARCRSSTPATTRATARPTSSRCRRWRRACRSAGRITRRSRCGEAASNRR